MTAPKVRVHEISKVLGLSNAEVIDALAKEFGVSVKSHSSTIDQKVADQLVGFLKNGKSPQAKQPPPAESKSEPPPPVAKAPETKPSAPSPQAPPRPAQPPTAAPPGTPQAGQPRPAAPPGTPQAGQPRPAAPPGAPQAGQPRPGGLPPRPGMPPQAGQPQGPRPMQGQPGQPRPGGLPPRPGMPPQGARPQGPRPMQGQPGQPRPAGPPGAPQAGQPRPAGLPPRPGMPPQGARPQGPRPMQGQPGQPRPAGPPGAPPPRSPQGDMPPAPGRPAAHGAPRRPSPEQEHKSRHPERELPSRPRRDQEAEVAPAEPKPVQIEEDIIVRDLALLLGMRETEIIKHLFMKGMMVTVNQTLDLDFARSLVKELGYEVEEIKVVKHEGEYKHLDNEGAKKLDEGRFKNLKGRAPVVSIMGHVDHGKTTLLDSIRETRHKVVDSEAGGITQSIGAYTVEREGQKIVFLDTPGHEAFTSMRMRGAQATDIAILVVAADDGVMPQTIEAINHAKVAKIPIIIAVNKIDKADADPDRVLVQLADHGLSAEKWGGDTLTCEVSALQKLGLDDVLDNILLVSELLELKADPTVPAEGVIVEAQLDKRMGPVATALIQNGTLKVGENVLIGAVGGRVRALISDSGERIQSAGPATPVEILGLDGVPNAGETFRVIHNDKRFKQELAAEKQRQREERIGVSRASVAGFSGRSETDADAVKENKFHLLVKADTQGSLEAVVDVLQRMTSDEVKINIVHSATGDISEADVMLASTANALIIGFNSKADPNAQRLADDQEVVIKRYDVIYHITEELEKWVLGQLEPETEEVQSGAAEVRQLFKVGKNSIIAGCMVTSGKVMRGSKAVVKRDGKEMFSGPLSNLKRFKDDVKEVASGYECGISFERFNDLQEGDVIEVFTVKSLERTSL